MSQIYGSLITKFLKTRFGVHFNDKAVKQIISIYRQNWFYITLKYYKELRHKCIVTNEVFK